MTRSQVGIADNYDAWRRDIQGYHESKKSLQFVQEPYNKVSAKTVKAKEVEYNPITQTFSNPAREQQVRNLEQ